MPSLAGSDASLPFGRRRRLHSPPLLLPLLLPPQGADPTARDGEQRTPLHHAVMRGHLAVVDLLLSRGGPALLLAKDILGCTPVHLAAVQNQARAVGP